MISAALGMRPCGSLATCKATSSTHSSMKAVQHARPGHEACSPACHQPGDIVLGKVISTGPRGSRVQLQQGQIGFLPHKLDPLLLQHSTHTYVPSSYRGRQADKSRWPVAGLVREFQVEKSEHQMPLLSASHVDYAVILKRAQQVSELCAECGLVLAARVTRAHSHGLHAACAGVGDGFIPVSRLPKDLRVLFDEQREHELVCKQLPVMVEEVAPAQHRIKFNCNAAIAAQRAALQPADLITGVVMEVRQTYAWVAMRGLDHGGFRAMLHRNDFSVDQSFCSLQDVLAVGESITAMLLSCELEGLRINLSTAHLELAAGDMLRDREAVYATAAQQAQLVKAQMQQAQAEQERAAATAWDAPAVEQPQQQQQQQQQQQEQLPKRVRQGQQQNGYARVLIADSLYQLAMASRGYYLSGAAGGGGGVVGRPALAVAAAAVWQAAPSNGWPGESSAASGEVHAAAGDALASQDQEQDWWASSPLAWKAADEREQWQAECQAAAARSTGASSTKEANKQGGGVEVLPAAEDSEDGEQQWLQPPLPHWDQGP